MFKITDLDLVNNLMLCLSNSGKLDKQTQESWNKLRKFIYESCNKDNIIISKNLLNEYLKLEDFAIENLNDNEHVNNILNKLNKLNSERIKNEI